MILISGGEMKKACLIFIACLLPLSFLLAEASDAKPPLTLTETYQKYIKSLQEKNLVTLFETLSTKGVDFITSNGSFLSTLDEYREYHQKWFAEENWTIDFKVQKTDEQKDYAYMLVIWNYQETSADGQKHSAQGFTTFLFIKEEGAWKLRLDAVTPIRKPQVK